MGSITYDFLADSLFLNQNAINTAFKNESDERIEKELADYREHCLKNLENLKKEINENASTLSVFSSTDDTPIDLLKQTALYMDQYVVSDPLFRYTNLFTNEETVMSQQLGFPQKKHHGDGLVKAAKYLKEITPMVAGNFVKIFPVSYHFEPPKELPFNIPVDYYNNILPREILNFFHENKIVNGLEKMPEGGWAVRDGQELQPCRGITIDFGNIGHHSSMLYFLHEMEILHYDERTKRMQYRQYLPETPPDEAHFNAWVQQSVNSAARAYFDTTFGEIYIASQLKSSYICEDAFTNDLISKDFQKNDSISSYTANQMLNIELPFLDKIDVDKLMQIRQNDADVFTNFRVELEKQFREIRAITDPEQIRLKTENIFHELNEVQGHKVKMKLDHLKKQVFLNSALAIGGLVGTVPTAGISLISTAVAAAKGYKDYRDYLSYVKENPAYFLWNVINR
ncbi:hypothetical protein SNE25_04030 [Mucilaginibacter sabulilitoris]|uniref:Coiled-coil protein n=1 Tax=Mucilaginibacter sabulilitoris TaxID=1173583 RepID=A0ABZ0TQE8_9SPHI|nr:hypothetical protein [Mucilaginibacter sabulilitoris]WPU94687.1 hypothetical protein SNE25_04030 [Mucilaginibacter sabulilitoris]